jgi:hypothetical protein
LRPPVTMAAKPSAQGKASGAAAASPADIIPATSAKAPTRRPRLGEKGERVKGTSRLDYYTRLHGSESAQIAA